MKKLKNRTLQGFILGQLLRRLASFCSPFGSIWVVLGTLLIFFRIFNIKTLSAPMSAKSLQDKLRGLSPKGSVSL